MIDEQRLLKAISGSTRSPLDRVVRAVGSVAEPAYRLAVRSRNKLYDAGAKRSAKLPRPVISVGNITTGGTGKTPMVVMICGHLLGMDIKPAILTRGYRATHGQSDEANEMGQALGDACPIAVNADRAAAGRQLLEQDPAIGAFVLDDGFQHRQLVRDLDIVLIDAMQPDGYGHVLPRGLLREPLANLARADCVIITRSDLVDKDTLADVDDLVAKYHGQLPLAHWACPWSHLRIHSRSEHRPVSDLYGKPIALIAGIGNPAALTRTAQSQGKARVIMRHDLPDHIAPEKDRLWQLLEQARRQGARYVLTTGKDMAKWRPMLEDMGETLPIAVPTIEPRFLHGKAAFDALLKKTLRPRTA